MDVINQAVEKLLALEERPTVICCINDESAFMMIRALNEHGVRVPQDISVAGFDNLVTAATHTPSLTTVQQNFLAIGKKCGAEHALHAGKQNDPEHRHRYEDLFARFNGSHIAQQRNACGVTGAA